MKKEEMLSRAIGGIDDRLIEDADLPERRKRPLRSFAKWSAAAAAFVLILTLALTVPGLRKEKKPIPSTESSGKDDMPSPTDPPPQPIFFESFESAQTFLLSADLSSYSEKEQEAYEKMIRVFREDGFLYRASCRGMSIPDGNVFLFPEARYEDIGIGCWFQGGDDWYLVIVYHVREGKERAVVEDWTKEYEGTYEIGVNADRRSVNVLFRYWTQGSSTYFFGYLDDRHYFLIKGTAPAGRIAEVIRGLSLEKRRV